MTFKVNIKHTEVKNVPVTYTENTVFLVQVAPGGGVYRTRFSFKGDLKAALHHYRCINVGRGYKKRLYAPDLPTKVIVKQVSWQ